MRADLFIHSESRWLKCPQWVALTFSVPRNIHNQLKSQGRNAKAALTPPLAPALLSLHGRGIGIHGEQVRRAPDVFRDRDLGSRGSVRISPDYTRRSPGVARIRRRGCPLVTLTLEMREVPEGLRRRLREACWRVRSVI